jgi:hypothetical protein
VYGKTVAALERVPDDATAVETAAKLLLRLAQSGAHRCLPQSLWLASAADTVTLSDGGAREAQLLVSRLARHSANATVAEAVASTLARHISANREDTARRLISHVTRAVHRSHRAGTAPSGRRRGHGGGRARQTPRPAGSQPVRRAAHDRLW